jgi:glycosyltransferase involved in cell wall biosynthesis
MDLSLYYIFTSAGLKSDSVQKKVIAQIRAMNSSGIKCKGLFFTQDIEIETSIDNDIILIPYEKSNRRYFNIIKQNRLLIKDISSYIEKIITKEEYLYIRYPKASFALFKFAKKNKYRIISEHQSKEVDEIRSTKNEHKLGLKASKIISFFLYQIWPIYNEYIWGKYYSKYLKAKVAVTNEIAIYHQKNCNKVWVIPNGIETKNFQKRKIPEFKDKLKILFLKGTSDLAPWNGLDRLIKSIDIYLQSDIKIELIICGNIIEGEIPNRDYIVQKGYLTSEELNELFSDVHIGFSTLCLFRKSLNEAAVLKAREYMVRGLPFVYAYVDPDIQNESPIDKYVLKIPNDNSIIDFNEIIEFAKRVSKDLSHVEEMRIFSEENLDWKAKMRLLKQLIIEDNLSTVNIY